MTAGVTVAGGVLLRNAGGRTCPHKAARRLKNYFADVAFPISNPRLSLAIGDEQHIEKMVRAAIGGLDPTLGIRRFISQGDVVLLKPNVGFDRPPRLGATTNPEVLRWIIRLCREAGAREIIITDNPIEAPRVCFARSGIERVIEQEGARLVLPRRGRFKMFALREHEPDPRRNEALGRWPILYEPLARATKLIGIAPVKDHNLCSASMILKNWYGLLGGRRNQFHQAIHNTISDLGLMFSPTLVIADATRVMLRNGPTGGRLSDVKPGGELGRPAVIASVDQVACDAWCYQHLLNRDPSKLAYLDLAHQKIQTQITAGQQRFGEHDWRVYKRQGMIASTST